MVLRPEKEAVARAVFDKWDLDFAIVGETIAEDRFMVRHDGEVKADLPLKALSGAAPEYDRPWVADAGAGAGRARFPTVDPGAALLKLMGSPNLCGRAWVWSQYDQQVMADTVVAPGSDAGVVRVHGTDKAMAFTSDVTPRYCQADPERGGAQAVAEAYRNLIATGARPLAATDNLNFGNPERPEIMGQFVGCIRGIARGLHGARHADRVGERQPLQRDRGAGDPADADDRRGGADRERSSGVIRMAPRAGDRLLLVGETRGHLGQSALLRGAARARGGRRAAGGPRGRAGGGRARAGGQRRRGWSAAAHDLSDGGLAVAAAEMALAGGRRGRGGRRSGHRVERLVLRRGPGAVPGRLRAGGGGRADWRWRSAAGVPLRVVGAVRRRRRCGSGDDEVGLAELRRAHGEVPGGLFD